jgi:hypothetical protein
MNVLSLLVPLILCPAFAAVSTANFDESHAPGHLILSVPTLVTTAPSNLTVIAASRNLIGGGRADFNILRWKDNSTHEYTFRVERCAGSGCTNFVEIAKLPHNTVQYYDFALPYKPGKIYRYRVRANGPYGLSAYTNIAKVALAF